MGYLLAVGSAVAIGLAYAIEQRVIAKFSTPQVMLIFRVFGLALISPVLFTRGISNGILQNKSDVFYIGVATAAYLVAGALMLGAMRRIGAAQASVGEITYPIFASVFVFLFYHQKLSPLFYVGAFVMVVGAAIVAFGLEK